MTNEILLTINVEREANGFYGRIEEGVTGSSSDAFGNTLPELVLDGLQWAGVTDLDLPKDPTMDDIATTLNSEKIRSRYSALTVRVFGEIWSI